ncbi:heterokaryon incompatibility protein-domain-containing protein [Amylocarpus encephaloides]|uniref:Heterokaryon incompatibility protein-domain-containing protein n=1 Tax=Amylocarpus encephaloides TaxID=45428 RepID=A0A9P7YEV4_9HELO|nr:heterokaryon incompatibility protein-domain-containing protein [Amylocarpus encephaloides]
MKCQACHILKFEPLDKVQKLASSESAFSQTLGTSLALSRRAIAAASVTKTLGVGVRGALNVLPPKLRAKVEKPGSAEVLHNSVYILHESLKQLELSAAGGCVFCRLLWGGLRNPIVRSSSAKMNTCGDRNVRVYLSAYRALNPERTLSPLDDQYITIECGEDRSMCLEITAGKSEPLGQGFVINEQRSTILKRAVRGFPSRRPNKNGTFPFDSAQVDLNKSHELCTCTADPFTPLPTRVVDLGPTNGSRQPYLYHSRGEHARYCTLSHRWGSAAVLRTTNDNLQLHKRQLPLQDLSVTFKDAINICRELCIRYLWIDSLCIIQDSHEDWEQESSRMGDYYWNSFCTIAADHATEENQGCFRQRDPSSIQPCLILLTFLQDINKGIAAVRVAPRIQGGDDWRHRPYSILDTRAWVLQERVLSPRMLFFGEHQLSFSCISMRASESVPEGSERTGINVQAPFEELQRKIRMYTVSGQSNLSRLQSTGLPKPDIKINGQYGQIRVSVEPDVNKEVDPRFLRELHDNWYELLREYNKRSITQNSDVLPALSGLAKRFQETIGETYLAGLWSGDMKVGLLWSVDETAQRATTYRAPSWSWASLRTCRLRFNCLSENVTNDTLCRILKAEVSSRGPNLFGEVTEGKLYVEGILKHATVVIPPKAFDARDEKRRKEVPDMGVRYGAETDLHFREIGDAMDLEKGGCAFLEDVDTKEQLCKFEPEGKFDLFNTLVLCLPIVLQRNIFGAEAALCLVLQPNFPEEPTWRRVGFARTFKVDWFNGAEVYPMTIV